ncbi:MAG: insulinase family protein [Acidobacteriota bacterium]
MLKNLRWLAGLAIFLALGCTSLAPAPVAPPTAESPLPVDPAVRVGKLDNGLTYIIRANGKPEGRAELRLVVDAGSLLEEDDQRGLAHFLEHMAFNGSRHFQEQELVDYLESIGMRFGPDINASTSFDETIYMLTVPTDDPLILDRAFLILEDWAHGIAFDPAEIDKERGVVIEEWRLGRGAGARLRDKQLPVLLQGSRHIERLPIGEVAVLESAPKEAFERFYRDWYRPDLMAVIAVGDFDPAAIEATIEQRFGRLAAVADPRPRPSFEVPAHEETLFSIESDPEISTNAVAVHFKLPPEGDGTYGDYRRGLVELLYLRIFNQRLAIAAREAEAPFLVASAGRGGLVRAGGLFSLSAGVEAGGAEKGLAALLTEAERATRFGITAGELERAKEEVLLFYDQALVERTKTPSALFASEYTRHFLQGEPIPGIAREVDLVRRYLPEITAAEVQAVGDRWIRRGSRVVVVTAPESAAAELPGEAELAGVLAAVAEAEIEPYEDSVVDRPLLAERPQPGTIVAESRVAEIDLTEWRLSNGAKVLLRPTDFQNDQILMVGFSPGGHSLVADEDLPSGLLATTLMDEGGLGEFDRVQLSKALAGVAAGAQVFITELEEGLTATASGGALEEMFELVYLRFTAPRVDAAAVATHLSRRRALLENRAASPGTVFGDRMIAALTQDHPRSQPPSQEMLDRVDLGRAEAIYRDRFGDAGDFTFILVGNFEPDELRSPVERFLASLPAAGREESWRDVGVRAPGGVVEVEVLKGLEPKATVQMIFNGPARWSRESVHEMATLEEVVRTRLREVLREDLGATYGVQVSGVIEARPVERAVFQVAFGCAPEKADELRQRVLDEIARLQREAVTAEELDNVIEAQTRERELLLKQNGFWIGVLKSYETLGLDPRLILAFDQLTGRMTPEILLDAAKRYIDAERYVVGVLRPEAVAEAAAEPVAE